MAAPAMLPHTFEPGLGYRTQFLGGREFIVPARQIPKLYEKLKPYMDPQGRMFVTEGQIINFGEKEAPVEVYKTTIAQIARVGGNPLETYYNFRNAPVGVEADSSGGTGERDYRPSRPDDSGGTGATGSGKPDPQREKINKLNMLITKRSELEAQFADESKRYDVNVAENEQVYQAHRAVALKMHDKKQPPGEAEKAELVQEGKVLQRRLAELDAEIDSRSEQLRSIAAQIQNVGADLAGLAAEGGVAAYHPPRGRGKRKRHKLKGGDLGDDIRRALDPNRNGLNQSIQNTGAAINQSVQDTKQKLDQSIQNTGRVLGDAFDPNKNGLAAAVNAIGDKLKAVDWNDVKNKLGDGLDPAKNGVSEAFNKFGGDATRAFEELGNKIKESAQRDKATLDRAFAPFVAEFTNPNSALAQFVQSAGIPISADDWKKKFEDPETYFTILSVLVTAAASVASAGLAGPGVFAATQALIAGTRVITKAAMGKPITPGDILAVVTSAVPGAGGGTATTWLEVAKQATKQVGVSLVKTAAKNVLRSNKDGLMEAGKTLATMSQAATPSPEATPSPAEGAAPAQVEAAQAQQRTAAAGITSTEAQPQTNQAFFTAQDEDMAEQLRKRDRGEMYYDYDRGDFVNPSASQAEPESSGGFDGGFGQGLQGYGRPRAGLNFAPMKYDATDARHPFFHIHARSVRAGRKVQLDRLDPDYFEGKQGGEALRGTGIFDNIKSMASKAANTASQAANTVANKTGDFLRAKLQDLPSGNLGEALGVPGVETNLANITDAALDRFGYNNFDARNQEFLKAHGSEPITSLKVRRAPISNNINIALNLLSLGQWDKSRAKYGYDDLFHLGLIVNDIYAIQRIGRVSVNYKDPDAPRTEFLNLPVPAGLTMKSMLEQTLQRVGPKVFFSYDPFTYNCQGFLRTVLETVGLFTPEVERFVYQPVDALLREQPGYVQSVAHVLTNFGQFTGVGAGKPTPAEIASAVARGDAGARAARGDRQLEGTEDRLDRLSQAMFGKRASELDDDENDQLDGAFQQQSGYYEADDAEDAEGIEHLPVIMKRRRTGIKGVKRVERAGRFMQRLKRPAMLLQHEARQKALVQSDKRNYNRAKAAQRADPDYDVLSDEDDTDFEFDDDGEQPRFEPGTYFRRGGGIMVGRGPSKADVFKWLEDTGPFLVASEEAMDMIEEVNPKLKELYDSLKDATADDDGDHWRMMGYEHILPLLEQSVLVLKEKLPDMFRLKGILAKTPPDLLQAVDAEIERQRKMTEPTTASFVFADRLALIDKIFAMYKMQVEEIPRMRELLVKLRKKFGLNYDKDGFHRYPGDPKYKA